MEENKELLEVAKVIAKPAYDDLAHPAAEATGKTLGLLPRTINAILMPLQKWVMVREFNIEATRQMLEEKLANTPVELIEAPEPYVAVPALQKISYCMDNEVLRDMYANLLATSMKKDTKDKAHPSFADIISQLSPDEAKTLQYFKVRSTVPTISIRAERETNHSGVDMLNNFSNIGELTGCEYPANVGKYFENLIRLGLISASNYSHLTNDAFYEHLLNHKKVKELSENIKQNQDFNYPKINKGYVKLTEFGKSFCDCCVSFPEKMGVNVTKDHIIF